MELSIRKKGLGKMVTGFLALIGASYFVFWLQTKGYSPNSFAMIGLGAPAAIGLVGLLEVLMNRPFSEMEQWWNGLRGWQRGLLGMLVVILAIALLFGGIAVAGILGII